MQFASSFSAKKMQCVLNLTKKETRKACESLYLIEGSRADMVEKTSHALFSNCNVVDGGFVLLMGKDDDVDKAIND